MIAGIPCGTPVLLAASAVPFAAPCSLAGFYVNSTTAGTIVVHDSASAATNNAVTGTITPAVGWHNLPLSLGAGLRVVIGATISVTFVYRPG